MKGMVFTMLGEMVEERFGIDTWDDLIDITEPASGGAYVSTDVYPDEELLAFVTAMSERFKVPAPDLVFAFGEYMLERVGGGHPDVVAGPPAAAGGKSVHDVIHVEVRKLHPDVVLPQFDYEDEAEDALVMLYRSPRELCALAEGLIAGAGKHFGDRIECTHSVCMHNGDDHCRLELSFAAHELAETG